MLTLDASSGNLPQLALIIDQDDLPLIEGAVAMLLKLDQALMSPATPLCRLDAILQAIRLHRAK